MQAWLGSEIAWDELLFSHGASTVEEYLRCSSHANDLAIVKRGDQIQVKLQF